MRNFDVNQYFNQKSIVLQNYTYLKNTDLMVCNTNHILDSPGSIWELSYAYFNKIPVIAFGEDKDYVNIMHMRELIGEHLNDLDCVVAYIENLYSQVYF